MIINSFCVIVSEHETALFWSPPQNFDAAYKLYGQKLKEYFPGYKQRSKTDGFSNNWIAKQINTGNDIQHIIDVCLRQRRMLQIKGIKIQFMHSSQT